MKTSAALFPFSPRLLPVVKLFDDLQDEYVLTRLISPSGFGLTGKDAGYSRNHPPVGLVVHDKMEPEDSVWETLLLIKDLGIDKTNGALFSAAQRALQCGKKVLYIDDDSGDTPREIKELSKAYSGMVDTYKSCALTQEKQNRGEDGFKVLDVPVVLVGGLVEEADTLEVMLRLTARMRRDGFFVTAITRHPVGKLLGLHTLNHVFDKRLTEAEKILELNQFARSLETLERPNVFLIEGPDAVMKYNNCAPNSFGIRTYMLCQAIRPDYFVCCVPCELAVGPFLDRISSDFEHRLGSPIHSAHVSNLIIDSMDVVQSRSISYVHADLEAVRKQIVSHGKGSSIPLRDVVGNGVEELYTHLHNAIIPERKKRVEGYSVIAQDAPIQRRIVSLLRERFHVTNTMLESEHWDRPLTGNWFRFSSADLVFIFLEIENSFKVRIPQEYLDSYGLCSINKIAAVIGECISSQLPQSL